MKTSSFDRRRGPFMPLTSDQIKAAERISASGCDTSPLAPPEKAPVATPTHTHHTHHPTGTPVGVPRGGGLMGCDMSVIPPPPSPATGVIRGDTSKKRGRRKPPLVILEDTRENTPLATWPDGVTVEECGLETGDYSIKGWENCFTVERKSITDLAGTMINAFEGNTQKPRKRFNNELERMRHFDCAAVIVTATPEQLIAFRHHCGMEAHAALWNFGLSVFARYGIPVFPLTDDKTAARWIADLARHYVNVRTRQNVSREEKREAAAAVFGF